MSDAPIRPWVELATAFRPIPWESAQAVADLCEFIAARSIGESLSGWKSGNVLCVAGAGLSRARLEIEPSQRGPVQFRYADADRIESMWRRHEPPEKVLDRFRRAVVQVHWIADPAALD